ncbi:UDP-N-acetylglucosamine transferase subunit [Mortierella alpina]|nr:UDP-N-acetylglucosamine transferase subunit [Mortierella alpina]
MNEHHVNSLLVTSLITAALIALPLGLILALRLRAALPHHRPRARTRRTGWSAANGIAPPSASPSSLQGQEADLTAQTSATDATLPFECTATIFLGSGGHTAEMLQLVSGLDTLKYPLRHYVVGWDDDSSVQKAHRLELGRGQKDITDEYKEYLQTTTGAADVNKVLRGYTIHRIPRSRHVHQSLISTPITLAKSLRIALPLIKTLTCLERRGCNATADGRPKKDRRSILLMNGPGTCFALALAVIGARIVGVPDEATPDLVFVESFARVQTLSLAGKLLYPLCDVFLVQWPGLQERYPCAQYIGILV